MSKKFRQRYRELRRRITKRQLHVESLEDRRVMAVGPRLVAVEPNDGLLLQDGDSRNTELVQLTFRFNEGQHIDPTTLSGIRLTRLGDPLNSNDDTIVQPGFIGVEKGPDDNIVVMRFSNPLPDDLFQIDVIGSGSSALRNSLGEPFNNGQNTRLRFQLDLGAKVIAVVPQPIDRLSNGTLSQRRNEIELYFNEELDKASAENPLFYRLIYTADTADNTDGITQNGVEKPFLPTSVSYSYNAATAISKAKLTFSAALDALPGLPAGTKTFRLRVGTDEAAPLPPSQVVLRMDAVSDFNSAGKVLIRLTADVAAAEGFSSSPRLFVDQADLGTTQATRVRVVDNHVFLTLNTNSAALATAQKVVDAINNSAASSLMTAAIAGGSAANRGAVVLSNLGVTYSPVILTGLGSSFATATDLDVFDINQPSTLSKLLTAAIDPQRNLLDFPGASDEPGHRHLPVDAGGHVEQHVNPLFGGDADLGVTTILYNFKPFLGTSPSGDPLENFITDRQKQRIREALEMWSNQLGVQFLETNDQGLTFGTGDPLALDPFADDVVNYALQKADPNLNFIARVDPTFTRGMLILDAARTWETNFGEDYYQTAMIGVGFLLGLQRAGDLPEPTTMSFGAQVELPAGPPPEEIAPGNEDIVHGQHLYRPDSNDIDLYRFVVDLDDSVGATKTARLSIETFAERRPNASSLDTLLTLYKEVDIKDDDGNVIGVERQVIARNDNYYSDDSYFEVEVESGIYFVQVTASGNASVNVEDESTGFGGTSQGPYELRIDLRPTVDGNHVLRDRDRGTLPGTPLDGDHNGSPGGTYNFWFRAAPSANVIFVDKSHTPTGSSVGSISNPYNQISAALAAAQPGSIVRIVGNGGADKNSLTLTDNAAYEIGTGTLAGQILSDGATMEIPKNVTVMVDSGAIFKLREARIGAGSSSLTIDRSAGSLQVLGTPQQPVYFTSWLDESIGLDTNQPTTTPTPGDWGGISFRADLDNASARFNYENQGIFLNYVNHADIRYGGGRLTIDSVEQVVQPVQMVESRPTISFNNITLSADVAMSADPNSFRETNFHEPRFQLFNRFTSDYQRVGPDINGNILVNNSTNGLFVSILTPAGNQARRLTVPARFDDTDVVHVIAENLEIQGTPGAPLLDTSRPPINVVGLSPRSGGTLPAQRFNYKVVFFNAEGFEGRPSEATVSVQLLSGQGSIRLTNLPPSTADFIGRRIYRSSPGGVGPYRLVAELNSSDTTFIDDGSVTGPQLQNDPLSVLNTTLSTRSGGTLTEGVYNYRVTYVDASGVEGPASDATVNVQVNASSGNQTVRLSGLPTTVGLERRIYRSSASGATPYVLVGEIPASQSAVTIFDDTGATLISELDLTRLGVLRARSDARLRVDAGIIVKLEAARIEASFGSQFIAEGRADRPVVFTSTLDDRFGAGGTFDTANDGTSDKPARGDWGGIFVGQSAEASIDHALLTFGGGDTRIEGTFVHFNVIEVHQAKLRLAHSTIEENADGIEAVGGPDADRVGRSLNEPATIFLRGTQAVLLENIIRDNEAQAITVDINSFNQDLVNDPGRSTGAVDAAEYPDNFGPLVRGNILQDNPNNGLTVRRGVVTSQAVFDDTDIVHVLFEEIVIPNFHTYGGLRIQSSPSANLVLKLGGGSRNTFDPRLVSSDSFQPHLSGPTAMGADLTSIEDGIAGLYRRAFAATAAQTVSRLTNLDGSVIYNITGSPRFGVTRFAPTAGLTASGTAMDIADRIGGILQLIGQPDFPVIVTSFHDDSVGAGFKLNGEVQRDTNNNASATTPQPGDWRSVRLEPYSHDRNVDVVMERESPRAQAPGVNSTPENAQFLGQLAAHELDGDNNLRLGFEVHGLLNAPRDVDVYSFSAKAGSEIWLDIDRTSFNLNSVVELVDADGDVIARSDDSLAELFDRSLIFHSPVLSDSALGPLQKGPEAFQPKHVSGIPKDFFSLNPLDAGMRLILPGVVGTRSAYHVRVRSFSPDIEDISAGQTEGVYQLQIRLREADEFPGSTIRNAQIRYAMNGIEVIGLPGHSPLLGEASEDEASGGPETNNHIKVNYNLPGSGPQDLGNIMATDRAVVSIAGRLSLPEDVDIFEFQVSYAGTSNVPFTDTIPVSFDIDYADGLSRPNTNISIFDAFGRLVMFAEDSNVADDQLPPLAASDLSDLSTGSAGPLDPFIGPVALPEGTYFVAISSNAFVPGQIMINPALRREPINSIARIVEDHIRTTERATALPPQVVKFLDEDAIEPQDPSRVSIYVIQDVEGAEDQADLMAINSKTGAFKWEHLGYIGNVEDITTRLDGGVYGFSTPDAPNDFNAGLLQGVSISRSQFIGSRDDGILTFQDDPLNPGVPTASNVGMRFNAATYGEISGQEVLLAVGERGDKATPPAGPDVFSNLLYRFDPRSGKAMSAPQANRTGGQLLTGAGTNVVERGVLNTNVGGGPGGTINGLSIVNGVLYALTDTGGLFVVNDPLGIAGGATLTYVRDILPVDTSNFPTKQFGVINEIEPNDDPGAPIGDPTRPQNLDREIWTQRLDPNIINSTINKHITINATGDHGFLEKFVRNQTGDLAAPEGMIVGPDGNIYITSFGPDANGVQVSRVLRFDGQTGEFMDVFVAANAIGGLDQPRGLAFAPNGNLLVSSFDTDQILEYDASTGLFERVFASVPSPTGLVFGDQVESVTTDFNSNGQVLLRFSKKASSSSDLITIAVNRANLIGQRAAISVNGSQIQLTLNQNAGAAARAQDVLDVIRNNAAANALINVEIMGGSASNPALVNVGTFAVNYSPIVLSKNLYVGNAGSDSIDRYTVLATPNPRFGQTGATYVAGGEGGLSEPVALLFGNRLDTVYSDLGTNGQTLLEFRDKSGSLSAIDLVFESGNLGNTVPVEVVVTGRQIRVRLNTFTNFSVNPPVDLRARAGDVVDAINNSAAASALVQASIVGGTAFQAGFRNKFVENNIGGIVQPEGMVVGPDGNIYVASYIPGTTAPATSRGQVTRFDGTTGEFIDVFVLPDAGGVSEPRGLAFAPNGNLLISSFGTDQILEYDGTTGVFLRAFATVAEPTGIIFGDSVEAIRSDFNSNGQVILQFAKKASAATDQISIDVRRSTLFGQRATVTVVGSQVTLTLSQNPASPARAQDVLDVINNSAAAAALLDVSIVGGTSPTPGSVPVGTFTVNYSPLVVSRNVYVSSQADDAVHRFTARGTFNPALGSAGSIFVPTGEGGLTDPVALAFPKTIDSAYTDFNTGDQVLVEFSAVSSSTVAIEIGFTQVDLGATAPVKVLVAGRKITVQLNTAAGFEPQASDVVDAINNHAQASLLVNALISGDADISAIDPATYSPVFLARNLYVNSAGTSSVMRFGAPELANAGRSRPGFLAPAGSADFVLAGTAGLDGVGNGLAFDADGFLYVSSINTDEVLKFDRLGGIGLGSGQFVKTDDGGLDEPGAILLHGGKFLVVSPNMDNALHSPPPTAKVLRYATDGAFVDSFIADEAGGLDDPRLMTFGPDGNLYVTSNAHSDAVLRYNGNTGKFLGSFVKDSDNGLANPYGLAFSKLNGDLYVASQSSNQILRYNGTTGAFVSVFTSSVSQPRGITFDSTGRMYVASQGSDSIMRFGPTGNFLGFFVTSGLGGLADPAGLVFGPDGNLYVASEGSNQILRYNGTTGAFLGVFSATGLNAPVDLKFVDVPEPKVGFGQPGFYLFVSSSADSSVIRFNGTTGAFIDVFIPSGDQGLSRSMGLAFRDGPPDDAGDLFVVSANTDEVFLYHLDGPSEVIVSNVNPNTYSPLSVARNLYVTSAGTGSVKRYAGSDSLRAGRAQPSPLAPPGSADFVRAGTAGLDGVGNGLAFDSNGLLYVSSIRTDEVLRFDETGQSVGTGEFIARDLGGLDEPGSILFHGGKWIVVSPNTDAGLHSDVPTAKVLRYSTAGNFIDSFIPDQGGGLDNPRHLTFGPDGNLYVTSNAHSDSVLRYNGTTGDFMGEFVKDSSGGLSDPYGIAFGPNGDLFVASFGTNQVLRYNGKTGNFIGVFAVGVSQPRGITFDSAGRMYVSSLDDDSVLRYSSTGQFLNFFIPDGALGGLVDPAGMKFGPDGHFYVASEGTGEILRYHGTTGAFIDVFTGTAVGAAISAPTDLQFIKIPAGSPGLEFIVPGTYMFVTSSGNDTVLRFDGLTGAFIDEFMQPGNEGLDRPIGMAYRPGPGGSAGELFVTSAETDEVFRYDIDSRETFDYFEFSVDAGNGSEVVIDIDFLRDDPNQPDTVMFLSSGAFNDDFSKFAGGEGSFRSFDAIIGGDPDAPLVLGPGTYVLAVAEFDAYNGIPKGQDPGGPTNPLDRNDSYTLHISMTDRDDFAADGLAPVVVRDFEGLASRPRQVGGFENVLFAVDTLGTIFALSVNPNNPTNPASNGLPTAFFAGDDPYVIATGADHARGLSLSDTFLHVTNSRHADPGHGLTELFDNSRGDGAIYFQEIEGNNTFGSAHNLELERWSLGYDSNIGDDFDDVPITINTSTFIPHVSINGTGNGSILNGTATRDFYSFVVTEPNTYVQLEVDFSFDRQLRANTGQPGNFPDDATLPYGSGLIDAQLRLFSSQGNLLAANDDTAQIQWGDGGYSLDPGAGAKSPNTLDPDDPPASHEPYLDIVLQPGRYVVEVTKFDPELLTRFNPPEEGDAYTLHVSVEHHPVLPGAEATDGGFSYSFATSLTGPVTNATATDPVQITSPFHGLLGGEIVYVEDVRGIRQANGTYQVSVVDEHTFELIDADGTDEPFSPDGPYLGGGVWRLIETPEDMTGRITSESFSLAGYAAEDKPVLYFNYLANMDLSTTAESFDVFIIVDGGAPQRLLAKADLDVVTGTKGDTNPLSPAPRDLWRQARIELDDYAGEDNLQIRFEFDTRDLFPSDFEGVFVDDFVVGFAERGEMVTDTYNDPLFLRDPSAPTNEVLTGEYQLEIRQASPFGESQYIGTRTNKSNSFQLTDTFDTNDRFVQQITLLAPPGAAISEGDLFSIGDGNQSVVFEFDRNGVSESPGSGHALVRFTAGASADTVAANIIAIINGGSVQSLLNIQAGSGGFGRVDLFGAPIVEGIGVDVHNGTGDSNRFRDQGQLLIQSNFVTNARDFGILADAAPRPREEGVNVGMLQPMPGAARNLQVLNNAIPGGIARGVTIENNVISGGGLGGIHVSGDSGLWELVTPRPLSYPDQFDDTSGDSIVDGAFFIVEAYGMQVRFEFEDISGDAAPAGSDTDGGNGWTPGSVPIFYRRSDGYLLLRGIGYSQTEMVYAIREAINSSILVTNGTSQVVRATAGFSRRLGTELLGADPALYLEGVTRVIGGPFIVSRRVPLQQAVQPFARIVNNTVYGHDGTESFSAGSAVNEPNDVISQAVQTFQGTANLPLTYVDTATIGDGTSTPADLSLDVDFYQIQLGVNDRVIVDIDANETGGPLDSVLRIFNSQGVQVAYSDNNSAPGESTVFDPFLDFTASTGGTYYVGVSASSNDVYSAQSLGNRQAARTRGDYKIEINVLAPRKWVIETVAGAQVPDGTTIQVGDRTRTVTFELDAIGSPAPTPGRIPIRYDATLVVSGGVRGPGYLQPEMAAVIAEAITTEFAGTIVARALGGYQGQTAGGPSNNLPTNLDYNNRNFGHDYDPTRVGYGQVANVGPFATGERFVVIEGAALVVQSQNSPMTLSPNPNGTNNSDQIIPERGIYLSERTSATLLNNVLANLNTGVHQTDSPTTIMGASLFQNNVNNHNISPLNESFSITIPAGAPLFVNAADGNFYPAPLSRVIDSSIDSLQDRDGIVGITQPLGISPSPILAPERDATGQLRVDDPDVAPPDRFGANVFKDRGGLDRADFSGPDAVLVNPQDNDADGIDLNPSETVVRLNTTLLRHISIQLIDGSNTNQLDTGIGVDDGTVTSDKITITRNGVLLKDGLDYTFDYDPLSNIVRLTHVSGVWPDSSVYVVQLNNTERFVFTAPDGSQFRDGQSFSILDESGNTVTFEFEAGFSMFIPEPLTLHMPASGVGPFGITDGQRFTIQRPAGTSVTFEYDVNVPPNVLAGNRRIDISNAVSAADVALATVNALSSANIGLSPRVLPNDSAAVHLGAPLNYNVDVSLTRATSSGRAAMVVDADSFVINDGTRSARFEFEDDSLSNGFAAGSVPIRFTHAMTRDELADQIRQAIDNSVVNFSPTHLGEGHLHLGGDLGASLDTAGAPTLLVQGEPGVLPSTRLQLPGRLSLLVPPNPGAPGGIGDGQFLTITDGATPVTFEFEDSGLSNGIAAGNVAVVFSQQDTVDEMAEKLRAAIQSSSIGLNPTYLGQGVIQLNAGLVHSVDTTRSNVTQFGKEGGIRDGETFVISNGTVTETFEFDSNNSSQAGNRRVQFVAGSQPDVIVDAMIAAIRLTNLGLTPVNLGAGVLQLNDTAQHSTDVGNSSLRKFGVPGGAIGVPFLPDESFTPFVFAQRIIDAIDSSPLTGVSVSLRGGNTYFVDGAVSVSGALPGFFNGPIEDLAGNNLKANQPSNKTMFTILTEGIGIDAGDAPDPTYPTLLENDGAHHAIVPDGLRLGAKVSSEGDGKPSAAANLDTFDDGVVFGNVYSGFITLTVNASTTGLLDGWIDLNADGDWSDPGEQVFRNEPMLAGDNPLVVRPTTEATRGLTYARFRFSTAGDLQPTGIAADGEVEDYRINVKPGIPPTTQPDSYNANEDTVLTQGAPGVLANDSNFTGVESSDSISDLGAIVNVNSNGSFTYDPRTAVLLQALALGATANDFFTYQAGNEVEPGVFLTSVSTTVSITIEGRNDAPLAKNFTTNAVEDGPAVIANFDGDDIDTDDDQGSLTYQIVTSPSDGTLTNNGNGSFTFDPGTGFQDLALNETRNVTFVYTSRDSHGATSARGTGTISVRGVNDAPTAGNSQVGATEDGPAVNGQFPGDDVDSDDNQASLEYTVLSLPAEGTFTSNGDGTFTFDPGTGFQDLRAGATRDVLATYRARDRHTATSQIGTITIRVTGVNDAPVAVNDPTTQNPYVTNEDLALTVSVSGQGVLANDTDSDTGDVLTVKGAPVTVTSANGAVVTLNSNGTFVYDPRSANAIQALNVGQNLNDTFTYTVTDSRGGETVGTATVAVSGRNDRPVANPATVSAVEDGPSVQGSFNGDDIDQEDTPTTVTYAFVPNSGPSEGSIANNGNGTFTFNPGTAFQDLRPGEVRTVTVQYTATDRRGAVSLPGLVSIQVTGKNDAPVAVDDTAGSEVNSSIVLDVLENDTDIDDSPFDLASVQIVQNPTNGTATVNADGTVTYQSNPGFRGLDTFRYRFRDAEGVNSLTSNAATVSVTVTDLPVCKDISVRALENTPKAIDVAAQCSDPDGTIDPTTVEIVFGPANGTAEVDPDNGTITYTPNPGFIGNDRIDYTIQDNVEATSRPARIDIAVVTNPVPYRNPRNNLDVNGDGVVTPFDALLVIVFLNKNGSRAPFGPSPPFYDTVPADNVITPQDALAVVSFLNQQATGGEGESEGEGAEGEGSFIVAQGLDFNGVPKRRSNSSAEQTSGGLPPYGSSSASRVGLLLEARNADLESALNALAYDADDDSEKNEYAMDQALLSLLSESDET